MPAKLMIPAILTDDEWKKLEQEANTLVRELDAWCSTHGVRSLSELTGTLEWPA